jgi:asparagine synthase (glutamine-hydrolysing)
LVSDVPFGAFLSGGIDSTIIAGAMAQISSNPINTFTIGFREKAYDESNLAGITAKKIGSNHHILKLEWDNAAENIEYVLSNMDEPFADSSLIATYTVSKMAREYVKVVLTGDSGDELFAGYNKYLISYYSDIYNRFPGFIRNGIIRPISDILPSDWSLTRKVKKVVQSSGKDIFMQRREMMCLGLKDDEIGCLSPQFDGIDATYDLICSYYDRLEDAEEITRAQYVDLKVVLEGDMLPKVDRASMLASLETRVPYIDSDLINIAYQIPSEYKIKGKRRKIILKDAFSDIIPEELLNAPKKGFSVPMAHWLRTILKRKLLSYASSSYMEDQGLFQAEFVNRLINEHMSKKRDRTSELWSFFVFQNWYDRNMA